MAGSRLFPNHQRTPSMRGSMIRYYAKGQWLTRSWPRKTGTPKSLKVQRQNNWFREAVQLAKRIPAPFIATAKEVALDTGLYPKDPIMASMAGNMYEVSLEDGEAVPKWTPEVHEAVFTGCRLRRGTVWALPAGVATPVPWDEVDLDVAGFFDPAEPTKITMPTGVSVINLVAGPSCVGTANTFTQARIVDPAGNIMALREISSDASFRCTLSTGPIATAPGLSYEMVLFSSLARNVEAAQRSFFSVIVLDTT